MKNSVSGTEGERGRVMTRAIIVRVSVMVGAIGIRDTEEEQARRQMHIWNCGGQRRGSVVARALSEVRGYAVLLFLMPCPGQGGGRA